MGDDPKQSTPTTSWEPTDSGALYRVLFEEAPDSIFIADPQGRLLAVNARATELTGYPTHELLGRTLTEFIHPEDLARDPFPLEELARRRTVTRERRLVRKDGRCVLVENRVRMLPDGRILGITIDIDERRRIESTLRETETRLSKTAETVPGMIYQYRLRPDGTGCFPYASVWCEQMFGITAERLRETDAPLRACILPEDRPSFEASVARSAATLEIWHWEGRMRSVSGAIVWHQGIAKPERLTDGSILWSGIFNDISQRKQAEEALRRSESRYAALVAATNEGIFDWDLARNESLTSARWLELYDLPQKIPVTLDLWRGRVHPEDLARVDQSFEEYLEGKTPIAECDYRILDRNGAERWLRGRALAVRGDDGRPVRVFGTVADITERKLAEQALHRQTALFRELFESSPEAIAMLDHEDRVLSINRSFETLFGYTIDEAGGRFINDLVAPAPYLSDARTVSDAVIGGGQVVKKEGLRCRRDGSPVEVMLIGYPIRLDGHQIGAYAIYHDITDRKRAERALRDSEARFRALFTQASVGIVRSDIKGHLLEVNPAFARMLGTTVEDLAGHTVKDFAFAEDWPAEERTIRGVLARGETSYRMEKRYRRADGREVWADLSFFTVRTGEGAEDLPIGMTNEITERIRSEEALRASVLEKESLLKEVHHRVKNNLQVISSLLNLQFRQVKNAELHAFLRDTQNRIRSMAMVHEILYQEGNVARISITRYIKSLCDHLARSYSSAARKIRIRQRVADIDLGLDQAIIAGLIINELVTNAVKHAFGELQRGEILVELEERDDHRLILRVADNGQGFPQDAQAEKADTLGLKLVRSLSAQLDGRLSVAGGQGAVFEIVFQRKS